MPTGLHAQSHGDGRQGADAGRSSSRTGVNGRGESRVCSPLHLFPISLSLSSSRIRLLIYPFPSHTSRCWDRSETSASDGADEESRGIGVRDGGTGNGGKDADGATDL